jgi:hypothetical protein
MAAMVLKLSILQNFRRRISTSGTLPFCSIPHPVPIFANTSGQFLQSCEYWLRIPGICAVILRLLERDLLGVRLAKAVAWSYDTEGNSKSHPRTRTWHWTNGQRYRTAGAEKTRAAPRWCLWQASGPCWHGPQISVTPRQ